jgi:hypothetical protein
MDQNKKAPASFWRRLLFEMRGVSSYAASL